MPLSPDPHFLQIPNVGFETGQLEFEGSLVSNIPFGKRLVPYLRIQSLEISGMAIDESFDAFRDFGRFFREPEHLGIQESRENVGIPSKQQTKMTVRDIQ
jgi:hypothetical protein